MHKPYYTSTAGGVKVGRWRMHKIGKVLQCAAQSWFLKTDADDHEATGTCEELSLIKQSSLAFL